ncbi:hypothetical protein [Candidatus Soleaferrea massiliensis]|nr:hypothetical protein [Candidatus Soleaferrea massiliensis]
MLGSISMDSMGMCSQCIRINIDERVRDNAKLHMLAELEHKGLL